MIEYMSTPEEKAKHPIAQQALAEIANGDVNVYNALWSIWSYAHMMDDLIDNSNLSDERKEQIMQVMHNFVSDLLCNPFVIANAREIRAVLVQAMTRNLDGDLMGKSEDPRIKALAPAVRCGDVDVILHLAYLAHGWEGLRKWSKLRQYDE